MTCPVCRARYRGSATCSRCGADLSELMRLAISAWRARQAAVAALATDPATATRLASAAQDRHATPRGRRLALLAAWAGRAGGEAMYW